MRMAASVWCGGDGVRLGAHQKRTHGVTTAALEARETVRQWRVQGADVLHCEAPVPLGPQYRAALLRQGFPVPICRCPHGKAPLRPPPGEGLIARDISATSEPAAKPPPARRPQPADNMDRVCRPQRERKFYFAWKTSLLMCMWKKTGIRLSGRVPYLHVAWDPEKMGIYMETYVAALDQVTTAPAPSLNLRRGDRSRAQYPFGRSTRPAGGTRPLEIWARSAALCGGVDAAHVDPIRSRRGITTSGRPPSLGPPHGEPYTTPSSGSAPHGAAVLPAEAEGAGTCESGPDCCWTPISPAPSCAGCWTTSPASGSGRSGASCAPGPWTPGSSGSSPAAPPM